MQLTKTQKVLHITFRILIFLCFVSSCIELFEFIMFGTAADSSYTSYSVTLQFVKGLVNTHYFTIGAGAAALLFSIICCRCTNVAATVGRTIVLALTAGMNCISIPVFSFMDKCAGAYIKGNVHSLYGYYDYASSDDFETAIVFAILFIFLSIMVYFVLSITSIVALAKKPRVVDPAYNAYYQNLYSGAYNNRMNNQPYMNNGYNMNNQSNMNNGYGMNNQQNMNNGYGVNNQPNMNNGYGVNNQQNMNNGYGMNNQQNMNNGYGVNNQPNMNNGYGVNNQPNMNNGYDMNNEQNMTNAYEKQEQAEETPVYDENGVKQTSDGRRVLRYDTMTGQPIYADEEVLDSESTQQADEVLENPSEENTASYDDTNLDGDTHED